MSALTLGNTLCSSFFGGYSVNSAKAWCRRLWYKTGLIWDMVSIDIQFLSYLLLGTGDFYIGSGVILIVHNGIIPSKLNPLSMLSAVPLNFCDLCLLRSWCQLSGR